MAQNLCELCQIELRRKDPRRQPAAGLISSPPAFAGALYPLLLAPSDVHCVSARREGQGPSSCLGADRQRSRRPRDLRKAYLAQARLASIAFCFPPLLAFFPVRVNFRLRFLPFALTPSTRVDSDRSNIGAFPNGC